MYTFKYVWVYVYTQYKIIGSFYYQYLLFPHRCPAELAWRRVTTIPNIPWLLLQLLQQHKLNIDKVLSNYGQGKITSA